MARIPKGIVITTSEHTKEWLNECIDSLGNQYPILQVANGDYKPLEQIDYSVCSKQTIYATHNKWNGFELGGILRGKETFDEFIHLMDTTIIKDTSIFNKLFDIKGHVFLTKGGYHYMGKFVSDDLPDIPKIDNKADAIALELRWLWDRARTYFEPDLPVHTNVFVEKHGRKNMVLENDYLIKYKATWNV